MLDAGPVPGDPDPGNLPPDIRGQLAQEPHQHHQHLQHRQHHQHCQKIVDIVKIVNIVFSL